jgi:Ca-activated chloride channel family protein
MTFVEPRWLWALALLPLFALLDWWAAARAERALLALVGRRSPHPLLAERRAGTRRFGTLLRLAALASLIVGAAEPEWGREMVRRTASGSDVVLLIDVSTSMDARDVPPSRLDEARREALAVLDRLSGSRVAVVAFAGDAVRLCPLTQDLGAARLVVESLWSGSVSEPGSDLGRALALARKILPATRRDEQAIVLWSDGEDLEHGAENALESIVSAGIRVFAVGVGTPSGDVIPTLDDQGRAVDVKRDDAGNAVRSRLDERLMRTLGRKTRGAYFASSRPGGELPRLLSALGTLARSGRGERLVERPVARFPLCAALAVLLLVADLIRPRRHVLADEPVRVSGRGWRFRPFARASGSPGARAAAAGAAALIGLAVLAGTARAQSDWSRGNGAFRAGRFADAETLYASRAKRGRPPAPLRVNLATARALNAKVGPALAELKPLLDEKGEAGTVARYNSGTLLSEQRQYRDALALLRGAIERNPNDEDARWNYEITLRKMREEQQRKKPPQSGGQKPEPAPSTPQSSSGGSQNPPPSGGQTPRPAPQGPAPPSPSGEPGSRMTRQQAEQILNALQDLSKSQEQRQRRVRVLRERRGRDW